MAATGTRKSQVDTRTVEQALQFEAWCDELSPLWDLTPPEQPATSYVGSLNEWHTPNAVFVEIELDGRVLGRPNSARKSKDDEWFGITLPLSGFGCHVVAGEYVQEIPGDVILAQSNKSEFFKNVNFSQRYVGLRYPLVGFDPSEHDSLRLLRNGSVANRLIQTAVDTMFELMPNASPAEVQLLEDGFCALVRSVALMERPSDQGAASIREARRHAMRKFVDEHRADVAFSLEQLQQAFYVSSATVKRDFADAGGFSRYLWRRRLEGALLDLAHADEPQRGLVGEVGSRWGFRDESSFRRAFRREFGFAPGEAVGMARLDPGRDQTGADIVGTPRPTARPADA